MKKIYHLSTCDTCKRIMNELELDDSWELIDIKKTNIPPEDLDSVAERAGGYEAIFSKRARKYRSMGLHEQDLKDEDYRSHMLEEYTFLKRPFIIDGEHVFVGNSKKVVAAAKAHING